jgi:hypothetical protein
MFMRFCSSIYKRESMIKISELVKMQGIFFFDFIAMARKSVFVSVLLLFIIDSCPAIAFQHFRPSYLDIPAQAHRVNIFCSGTKVANPRQFAISRTCPRQAFTFDVCLSPTSLALQLKLNKEEMEDDSSASSTQSKIMQEFVSLYQAAIDAGTFIKCTLSANKGEDRLIPKMSSLQSTLSFFFPSPLSPLPLDLNPFGARTLTNAYLRIVELKRGRQVMYLAICKRRRGSRDQLGVKNLMAL